MYYGSETPATDGDITEMLLTVALLLVIFLPLVAYAFFWAVYHQTVGFPVLRPNEPKEH